MPRSVVSLHSRAARDELLVGGKAAGLAQLIRRGFTVPPGFVVVLSPGSYGPTVGVERQIRRLYRKLGGKVAVRSSMVGEDSTHASFAGQLETMLNVEGEDEVVNAVRRCTASLFGSRVEQYRVANVLRDGKPPMPSSPGGGIIIQMMRKAAIAGVAFSADPISGERNVIIEAAPGTGERVVGGTTDPDRFIVNQRGEVTVDQRADPTRPGLEPDLVGKLARMIVRIATELGRPSDVEWLWDGTQFVFLQARPITTLQKHHVYSRRLTSDMMPGLIRPLVWSTNAISMSRNVIGRIFGELIGPTDFDFTSLVKPIHSRIYADITALGVLFERIGLPANFLEMVARDEMADRRRPPMNTTLLRSAFRFARFLLRERNLPERAHRFLERHDKELESYRNASWNTRTPEELLQAFEEVLSLHGSTQWFVFLCALNMNIRNRLLTAWVKRKAPGIVSSDLLRGLLGLKALEPNFHIQNMGAKAAALGGGIPEVLATEDDATIRRRLSESTEGRALLEDVEKFMKEFGFLSANGTDYAGTPWIENPRLIWSAIGRSALSISEKSLTEASSIREDTLQIVRRTLTWPARLLFNRLITSTIQYIHLREQVSLFMSEDAYQMRRIALALGEKFVSRNIFAAREDVFHLRHDELTRAVQGDGDVNQLQKMLAERREVFESDRLMDVAEVLCGAKRGSYETPAGQNVESLTGITGSSGCAEGYARVVWDPAEVTSPLHRTDILVVPYSDVGWTPLFSGIGGIVAETGGQLSHTAIVAREYNLPAVVSVKKATRLIRNGQLIRIDADAGKVYLLHSPGG